MKKRRRPDDVYLVLYENDQPIAAAKGHGRMIDAAIKNGFKRVTHEEYLRASRQFDK